jgi:hypothetical protein
MAMMAMAANMPNMKERIEVFPLESDDRRID